MFVQILFWALLYWLGAVAGILLVIRILGELRAYVDTMRTTSMRR